MVFSIFYTEKQKNKPLFYGILSFFLQRKKPAEKVVSAWNLAVIFLLISLQFLLCML